MKNIKKLNKVIKLDLALIPMALLSIITGFLLHAASHGNSHALWEFWAVVHILCSIAFMVMIGIHIKHHKAWFVSFIKNMRIKTSKGRMNLLLLLFFIVTISTGLILLFIWDDHSKLGLWHYKIGILFAVLSIAHIIRRHAVLHKII